MNPDVDGVVNSYHYFLLIDPDWKDETFIAQLLLDIDDARNATVLWRGRPDISHTYFHVHRPTGSARAASIMQEMRRLKKEGNYCFQLALDYTKSSYGSTPVLKHNSAIPLLIFSSSDKAAHPMNDVIALAKQMRVPYHHWQGPQDLVKTFNPLGARTLGVAAEKVQKENETGYEQK